MFFAYCKLMMNMAWEIRDQNINKNTASKFQTTKTYTRPASAFLYHSNFSSRMVKYLA